MSVESISKVLNADLDCTPTQKLILVGIANHDGDGGAWPSIQTLARYAGVSYRSAQRAIGDLEKSGLIVRHVNQGGTARTPDHSRPNLYELTLTPPDTSVGTPPDTSDGTPPTPASPEPSLNASVEPSPPKSPPGGEVEVLEKWEVFFEQFWNAYPRRVAKPAARRAMKKAWANSSPEKIAEGTRNWVAFWTYSDTEEQFIPHPSTFLNQERYNDPLPEPSTVKKKMSKAEEAIEKIRNRDQ